MGRTWRRCTPTSQCVQHVFIFSTREPKRIGSKIIVKNTIAFRDSGNVDVLARFYQGSQVCVTSAMCRLTPDNAYANRVALPVWRKVSCHLLHSDTHTGLPGNFNTFPLLWLQTAARAEDMGHKHAYFSLHTNRLLHPFTHLLDSTHVCHQGKQSVISAECINSPILKIIRSIVYNETIPRML